MDDRTAAETCRQCRDGRAWSREAFRSGAAARQFVTPAKGVLRLDDSVLVTRGLYGGGVILRHYAFADRWVKINVTMDAAGRLTETPPGGGAPAFCFNCDIATPMLRRGADTFAVDLFADVLVRADGTTFAVTGEDEMRNAIEDGLISQREAAHGAAELELLTAVIAGGRLLEWLTAACPFGPAGAPPARPVKRVPVPAVLWPGERATW
jgi:hypothetical protein